MSEANKNKKFNFKSLEELQREIEELNLDIATSDNLDILAEEVMLGDKVIPNRLVVHPMEGADGNADGTPGELTKRRYERFARGGAGLLWFEAVAVDEDGRMNQSQLYIKEDNVDSFKELVSMVNNTAKENHGEDFKPYSVIQLTHGGRFGCNRNMIFRDPLLDKVVKVDNDNTIMSDEKLERLEDSFVKAAKLSKEAGFDAVDIKSCHRYLLSEILAGHTREGKYGGSYENRTRFLKNVISRVKEEVDIDIVVRLNIYDDLPSPYGWGTNELGEQDLAEPKRLVRELEELGVKMINITASTPYFKPHINRPYDHPGNLGYPSPEYPLVGTERLIKLAHVVKKELKDCLVVGTGYSWFRELSPYVAAGEVEEGWADLIGFGRMAFAYPDFAQDIINKKELDVKQVCITCSKCAELKASKKISGCVIRDQEIYLPIYRDLQIERKKGEA